MERVDIQLTKNKMDLNIRKMINHPPSSVKIWKKYNNNNIPCLSPYTKEGSHVKSDKTHTQSSRYTP